MATVGFVFLIVAFAASIVASVSLPVGHFAKSPALGTLGRAAVALCAIALFACCALLVYCFMTNDLSIMYVLEERTLSTDGFAWLYRLSGLWAGRAGSLLFWTFLIALFNGLVFVTGLKRRDDSRRCSLDALAMAVISVVVVVFCGVLLFSEGNMAFVPTPANFFDASGELTATASLYAMNPLLEHWAMAIHPPLLFVGYAGLTVPFGFALAALILGDFSKDWVRRSQRFVLASWLFLGAGIGLGAVWAYGVLGWGGYWGWDPVENASLVPWLVCVALMHTFTVYRQRGAFKRWAILCACLAFTFVIVATFITRSGIVQSVHAFAGDPVSLALFGTLILLSVALPVVGIAVRWKGLASDDASVDDIESILSKDAAYYFNNVVMLVLALLLVYMTLVPGLPSWLPLGGDALGASAFDAIARPVGIIYLFILALCPLLSWGRTDLSALLRTGRVPALCALALFVVLVIWWATQLLPVYDAMMAKGDSNSLKLLEAGPAWYYNGLAVAGFFVASLLFFNGIFMLVRNMRRSGYRVVAIGGTLSHMAMAIILVGLIGSSMYVYEQVGYMGFDGETQTAEESMVVGEYRLEYAGQSIIDDMDTRNKVTYEVVFDVYKDDRLIGQAAPSVQLDVLTNQQKLNAAVLGSPEEDLFIVYRGVDSEGAFSLDVRINPFIGVLWIGFVVLLAGMLVALVGKRGRN